MHTEHATATTAFAIYLFRHFFLYILPFKAECVTPQCPQTEDRGA